MNLHGIANAYITAVNPNDLVSIQINQGYGTSQSGKRTATYGPAITNVVAQIQTETFKDLVQGEGINQNGIRHVIYFNGLVQGVVRWTQQGGDLITFADGSVWLTTQVLEMWPNWCKVAVTLQDGS